GPNLWLGHLDPPQGLAEDVVPPVPNSIGDHLAYRTFFSFHYQRDIWRVNIVRNSNMIDGAAAAGWHDASLWEETKRQGDAAVKRLIDKGLEGTTVTVVCIGAQTASRKYVDYEIERSAQRKNLLLGVRIHHL